MIHWGINALNHGSSVAVFKNDELVLHTNNKSDQVDIALALEYGAPDRIFWYERPFLKKARQLYAGQYKTAFDMSVLPKKHLTQFANVPVTYTPHHASHAAAGYYTSPFSQCAIVVLDAMGEFECATIWAGNKNKLRKVWSRSYPNSLGLFYSAFTQLIGLTPIKDEYLLQQMAEQGDPDRFFNYISTKYFDKGAVNLKYNFHRGVLDWIIPLLTLQDQCDVAAAVQQVFEHQVAQVMKKAKELVPSERLVYMGGCAMNSAANKKIVEPMYDAIWSLPNPGDPSSSIGAVLYHTKHREWRYHWDIVTHIKLTQ